MRALVLGGHAGPASLELREIPAPQAGAGEVRVRVRAVGINRADLLQCLGRYPGPSMAYEVPGLEFSGVVESLGPGAPENLLEAPVCGILAGGAYAEYVVTAARLLLPVPDGFSFEQAAAIPEAFLTAHDALHNRGAMQRGETVLVHAAASGVGIAALQLARLAGARVLATLRSASKVARLRQWLSEDPLVLSEARFADAVRERTGGRGADLVLDFVGAAYLEENLRALAPRGRLVVIGLLGGTGATLDLGRLLTQRLRIEGTVLRSRPLAEKIALTEQFRSVLPHFQSGSLAPVIDTVFPFEQAAQALELMAANRNTGKLILTA
jgi:putative PIG3 family NAD(P)H quinone oxidoreductase